MVVSDVAQSAAWLRSDVRSRAGWGDGDLQLQHDILNTLGINFNPVGGVETFSLDFRPMRDHIGAEDALRPAAIVAINPLRHKLWVDYYNAHLISVIASAAPISATSIASGIPHL